METITLSWLDIIFLINIGLAAILIIVERHQPETTMAWLLLLLFLPVLGFLLYLFLGQNLRRKRLFFLKEEEEREIYPALNFQDLCLHHNLLPFNDQRTVEYQDLIHMHLTSNQALFTQDNHVEMFNDGQELHQHMLHSISMAEEYIHMEYYIIRNDETGREIIEALTRKAREGVQVWFLYDGMGGIRLPRKFFRPLTRAGGKVACFFPPFLPYINLRINYRNHRKICLIDGKLAYVGGFNIGDEYLGLSPRFGYWRDTHLCLRGSAIHGLQFRFLLDWRFAAKESIRNVERYFPFHEPAGSQALQIVSSGPDAKWASIHNGFLKLISQARDHVYIQSPYFIPDASIQEALKIAALSGVDVRLMIPGKRDHPFILPASLSYVGELLEAGVRCFQYKKGFLHSKMITIDNFASSVGTANMDRRSFYLNFEINAFIYDEAAARQLTQWFEEDMENSEEITLEKYRQRSLIPRIREGISRLLSPLL